MAFKKSLKVGEVIGPDPPALEVKIPDSFVLAPPANDDFPDHAANRRHLVDMKEARCIAPCNHN